MRTTRSLLLKYFHDSRYNFRDIVVVYRDRGAPGDISRVPGPDIRHLDVYYMEVSREEDTLTAIPYHRILRIEYGGQVIWETGHLVDSFHDESVTGGKPG